MNRIYLLLLVCCLSGVSPLLGQSSVWSEDVDLTFANVRNSPVVAASITVNLNAPGKVIVSFDGMCISSVGDLIVLAASNIPDWEVNDGNAGVAAHSASNNTNPFSHTRVYDVPAGQNTFYAIVQNYVYTNGSGIASVYGSLTVEYLPQASGHILAWKGIAESDVYVKGVPVVMGQVAINPTTAGKVIVKFDGTCYATAGDRIVLAASNTPGWSAVPGNVSIEVTGVNLNKSAPFSHTRAYDVQPGSHTYYAVVENFVEVDGQGTAGVYGTLSVEFIPTASQHKVLSQNISLTDGTLEGSPVVLGMLTLNAAEAGKALISFNGVCLSDVGDLIVIGVNDKPDWDVAPGSVAVKAIDADVNRNSFSHTRLFDVGPGSHNFFAVAQNYVETSGNGKASLYGTFLVRFFPNSISSSRENLLADFRLETAPNPTAGAIWATAPELKGTVHLWVSDASGKTWMQSSQHANPEGRYMLDLSSLPAGAYFLTLSDGAQLATKAIAKQ